MLAISSHSITYTSAFRSVIASHFNTKIILGSVWFDGIYCTCCGTTTEVKHLHTDVFPKLAIRILQNVSKNQNICKSLQQRWQSHKGCDEKQPLDRVVSLCTLMTLHFDTTVFLVTLSMHSHAKLFSVV